MGKGWKKDSYRHGLASKGIETSEPNIVAHRYGRYLPGEDFWDIHVRPNGEIKWTGKDPNHFNVSVEYMPGKADKKWEVFIYDVNTGRSRVEGFNIRESAYDFATDSMEELEELFK